MVVEDGLEPSAAVRRAAGRLGVPPRQRQLSRPDLDRAVDEYRSLFHPQQADTLQRQRALAREAMQAVARFQPRLFGALAEGYGALQRIRLLLVADTPETVIMHLADRHLPWHAVETTLERAGGVRETLPTLRFHAGDSTVELVVGGREWAGVRPLDPIGGRPMRLLRVDELEALLGAPPASA
jgi:hypothetical protein